MSSSGRLSRRDFLRVAATGAGGLLLASCTPQPAAVPTSVPVVEPTKAAPAATSAPAPTQAPAPTAVPPAPTAVPPAPAPVTLEFWETQTAAGLTDAEKVVFEGFAKAYPNIKVNFVEVPFEQSHEKLVTAFAANSAPDAFRATGVYNSEFAASGYLHPLNEYMSQFKDDIIPIAIDEATFKGQMTFLPLNYDIYVQYYRKDILDAAGTSYPETLDQLLERGLKLTDSKKPLYMFPVRGNRHTHFMALAAIMSRIGTGVDNSVFDESGKCVFTSAEAIEAYQWWGDLLMTHKISPPTSPTDQIPESRQQFFSGTLATHWDFIGSLGGYVASLKPEQFGTALLPTGVKGSFHTVGGNGYYISKGSKVKDAAWTLLSFAFQPENDATLCKGSGHLPTNKAAFSAEWLSTPIYKAPTEVLPQTDKLLRTPGWLPEWTQYVTEIAINNNTNFLLGKMTAKESLDTQAAFLEAAQARYLKG